MKRGAGQKHAAKLRTRMVISMAVVFVLFIVALATALIGMQGAQSRFEQYVNTDQERLLAGTGMYAQGLQMEQALRNIVMDPENRQAYKNLDEADKAFRQASEVALSLSRNDTAARTLLQEVVALRDKQRPIHARVVEAAAKEQAAAIAIIRAEETPVWREMRTRLQDFIKSQRSVAGDIKSETMAFTQNALLISVCLGLFAILAGAGLMTWLTVRIMKKLGGEPDYAARIAQNIAAGDLTGKIALKTGDTTSLLYSMRTMQEQLGLTLENIRHVAESISGASREIATGNADLSSRTESQAASLEETASSMQQLTGTVRTNAESAHEASRLASDASGVAARGGDMVGRVVETMHAIKAGSSRISDIIGVIDGIAFQTNILALNAAVEAARAGEQGRGFAVVAAEVRTLAQRSATAAREIKQLIGESVDKVDEGSRLVDSTGKTMSEIVAAIARVTHIMEGIARASEEQATGIEQVNQAVVQMDETTQQNAALVEQAAAAAQSMQDQAIVLMQAVDRFRLETGSMSPLLPADGGNEPAVSPAGPQRPALRLT